MLLLLLLLRIVNMLKILMISFSVIYIWHIIDKYETLIDSVHLSRSILSITITVSSSYPLAFILVAFRCIFGTIFSFIIVHLFVRGISICTRFSINMSFFVFIVTSLNIWIVMVMARNAGLLISIFIFFIRKRLSLHFWVKSFLRGRFFFVWMSWIRKWRQW